MVNIATPIIVIDKNKCQVDVDLNCYAQEAVDACVYKYTDKFYIYQKHIANEIVRVVFESKEGKAIEEVEVKRFCNELVDQQIRYNTNKQFGHIRDMIVEQAFRPVEVREDKDKE